jgi:hypothetical protein
MSQATSRLAMPLIQPAQAQKHVTHNEALLLLDAVTQLVVESFAAEVPPEDSAEGEIHALSDAPQGDWAGRAHHLAIRDGGGWLFVEPQEGWRAWGRAEQEFRVRTAGGWMPVSSGGTESVPRWGVGAEADETNRLVVASEASLLTNAGADHRLKINKAASADTASLLFQSGWEGRAEMGLAGSDGFSLKVSPDGEAWSEALSVDPASGRPTLPQGLEVLGLLTGSAVTQNDLDATPGRLLRTADFGLGADAPPGIEDFTAPARPGFYRYFEATAAGLPANLPFAGFALCLRTISDGTAFVVWRHTGNPAAQRVWIGTRSGAAGPLVWHELQTRAQIVGDVSQSGGTPTGAIIERGSNANGSWTRFADGTMQCRTSSVNVPSVNKAHGALFRSADMVWNFPVAFAAAPVTLGTADNTDLWVSTAPSDLDKAVLRAWSATSRGAGAMLRATASGRWF